MRLVGIDLSAAADAGRALWIAEGRLTRQGTTLDRLRPARDLPGGALDREATFAALRGFLASLGPALVGIDAPNSLPRALVATPWSDWLAGFAASHPTPEVFRAACRQRTGGRELRRASDVTARTPFAPWNLRLYRQTWHAVAALYAPLVAAGAVTVAPFQPPDPGRPRLAEICPASTLKHLGLYRPYKGRGATLATARQEILAAMVAATPLKLPAALAACAMANPGGDALDAIIALAAAARCQRAGLFEPHDAGHEGAVYVWA